MQLINSPRRGLLARTNNITAALAARTTAQQTIADYVPAHFDKIGGSIESIYRLAASKDATPTQLSTINGAFGSQISVVIVSNLIAGALTRMGESAALAPEEITRTAATLVNNPRFAVLAMPIVVIFFKNFADCEYKLFGAITPRTILQAFNEALPSLQELHARLATQARHHAEAEKRKQQGEGVTFTEWARSRGYDPEVMSLQEIVEAECDRQGETFE